MSNKQIDGGPYGRDNIPIEPPKPVHFSLWRPVGGLLYGFLMQFFFMYYSNIRWGEKERLLEATLLLALLHLVTPAIVAACFGFGWWSLITIPCWAGWGLLVHFTFHLDREESRQYWKAKLIP